MWLKVESDEYTKALGNPTKDMSGYERSLGRWLQTCGIAHWKLGDVSRNLEEEYGLKKATESEKMMGQTRDYKEELARTEMEELFESDPDLRGWGQEALTANEQLLFVDFNSRNELRLSHSGQWWVSLGFGLNWRHWKSPWTKSLDLDNVRLWAQLTWLNRNLKRKGHGPREIEY